MIVALSGGVGGAKLVLGLSQAAMSTPLTAIVNTGDDVNLYGVRICPDLDTVIYTLSGDSNPETGWGLAGDSFHCLERLAELGAEAWFQLGDRDLALHLWRTHLLRQGIGLAEITKRLRLALGVGTAVLPMTEQYVPTYVRTTAGRAHLQEYLVRDRAAARVQGFEYSGIEIAKPAPGIEGAIREARLIVICPSNPFISVGPILAVPGMKQLLSAAAAPVVAVSPIVAGKAVKGPAGKMLEDLGCPVSAAGVAALYKGVADLFVLDRRDRESRGEIEGMGMKVLVAETMMHTDLDKRTLARQIIDLS